MKAGLTRTVGAVGILLLAAGLFLDSGSVSEGVREGLSVCANTLIPSLFPFMVLSGFLSLSEYGAVLARPLTPLWRYLYRVPEETGAVVLLSLIGGYPVGAKGIASLLRRGVIDEKTAGRMLCFCVNCGPSFLITAIGTGLLFDRTAGLILFATQTTATLLVGAVASLNAPVPRYSAHGEKAEKGVTAFVSAVAGASSAMMLICAFTILFSGILSLLRASGLTACLEQRAGLSGALLTSLLSGFFEVTSGCLAASALGGRNAFLLISVFTSFGGLSVIFQIISCFSGTKISFRPFLISRLAHIPLAAIMALPLWGRYCHAASAFLPMDPPTAKMQGSVWVGSLCLIGMCTIMIFSTLSKPALHKSGIWDKITSRHKRK